jgi:hypothetical protein
MKRAVALWFVALGLVVGAVPAGAASDKTRIRHLEQRNAALAKQVANLTRQMNAVIQSLGNVWSFDACFIGGLGVNAVTSPDLSFSYLLDTATPGASWYFAVLDPACLQTPAAASPQRPLRSFR